MTHCGLIFFLLNTQDDFVRTSRVASTVFCRMSVVRAENAGGGDNMAGHSHWAGIRYKKAQVDARRGRLFSKLARQIMIAAREGGGDPESNIKLKYAIEKAKEANMPKENIERAIRRGTGESSDAAHFEEVIYEGYAPGGVAVLIQVLTDNRNRTAGELRYIFSKKGGSLSEKGSVAWMFDLKGMILVEKEQIDEDAILELALEAGAEDIKAEGDFWTVYTQPSDFEAVKDAFRKHGIKWKVAELSRIPKSSVKLDAGVGRKVLELLNALEEHDDVQQVWANFDIPEDVMEQVAKEVE